MNEAIEASLDGRDLFPDRALFINADEPDIERTIPVAGEERRAVVLCYSDGSRHILRPAPAAAAG